MTLFLIGLVLGAFGTWVLAARTLRRPSSEQQDLFDKLHPEVRSTLLADARRHLGASDLRELFDAPQAGPSGSIPQEVCPECGTNRLYHGKDYAVDFAVGADGKPRPTALSHDTIECEECGWKVTASSATDAAEQEGSG
jgi:DNA-directed RNA polymerase subunit RPC12/RpoP